MKIKVIGIGSRIMKDDGIGVRITEDLMQWMKKQGIQVILGETDAESSFYQINEEDFLIIIDATLLGFVPGTISKERLEEINLEYKGYSQHDLSIIDLLFRSIKKHEGYFIGVEAAKIGFGTELSEQLHKHYTEILEEVKKIIIDILKEWGGIEDA